MVVLIACRSPEPAPPDPVDPVPDRVFDDAHALVVPDRNGLTLLHRDGEVVWREDWDGLVGPCAECGGEGSSADGDGLLVAFTTNGPASGGSIARIGGDGALDWRIDGLVFPHDAVRDPSDGTVLVPEATANRITWWTEGGDQVRALDDADPGWVRDTPNGVDRVDDGDRTWLVSSHRGDGTGGVEGSGEITLWDLTDPGAPALAWTYPSSGSLNTPHGAILRRYEGRWWLVYAHSLGDDAHGSTVGLAVTDDLAVAPAYVADLTPVAPVGPFAFLRGVELTADGELWLVDSGSQGGFGTPISGRVVTAPMPDLDPTGASGAAGEDQVFVDLTGGSVAASGFEDPFEGWLWLPTF